MFGLGVVFIGLFLAGRIARLDVFTLSELLQRRFGHGSGYVSAIVSTIYTVLIAVVQIIALGAILKELLGWSLSAALARSTPVEVLVLVNDASPLGMNARPYLAVVPLNCGPCLRATDILHNYHYKIHLFTLAGCADMPITKTNF